MAKEDYPVIVYQILSYLYNCLKKGTDVDVKYLQPQGQLFNINSMYWRFILFNLVNDGYIDGVTFTKVWGEKYPQIDNLENIGITSSGIQFLIDNSFMEKAKALLKDTKAIIPFI